MKILIYIFISLCLFSSCTNREEDYKGALVHAQHLMEASPDSSLAILDTLGNHSDEFGRRFRMKYELALTYAKAKTGIKFETDSLTRSLVEYFNGNGSREEQTLAFYMNGCALSDIGETPEALQSFYDAIEKSDTTKSNPPYEILRGVYGQMALIFHLQNLPQDEIWALRHYIDCVKRTSDEVDYMIAEGQMIRPYYLLGEKDSVLHIIHKEYLGLKRLGENEKAVSSFGTAIQIYVDRNQLQKAAKAICLFEHESGLFDINGNIARGWEGYYFTKGFYEQAVGNINSAEHYFRKAIQYGCLSEGYKGLLHVYRARHNMDSVMHYSCLYEAAQDSLNNKMQTETIHQMSVLYNYSRSQKEAEAERVDSLKAKLLALIIFVAAITVIGLTTRCYLKKENKRKQKIAELTQALEKAKSSRTEIIEELRQLKSQDYEGVIAAKENKLAELSATIERLQTENESYKSNLASQSKDHLDQFINSDIASLFYKKATDKTVKVLPTEAEWRRLVTEFSKDNPSTYKHFGDGKALSKLELRICILLILDIPEYVISIMTKSSAPTVSNSKARANEKLFGKRDARSLRINLLQALKST